VNSDLVILEQKKLRIINIFRSFNLHYHQSQFDLFKYQIDLIHAFYTNDTILFGDFNPDWNKKECVSYQFPQYFDHMDAKMSDENLIQIVDFPTYSRTINEALRESLIDHIYVAKSASTKETYSVKPLFGDLLLLLCCVESDINKDLSYIKILWKNYTKTALREILSNED
jgi:endonuclease/exonuclease/phosphatase family metal-dependent hydrolase